MLATLNDKQNDPHDVIEISPDVVLASRKTREAPTLVPEVANRPEPAIAAASDAAGAAPSVDHAVRAALSDYQAARKRSSAGKWLRRVLLSMLFAGGSAAAAVAWEHHGHTVKQMAAAWMPAFVLTAAPSLAAPASDDRATDAAQTETADQAIPPAETSVQPQEATAATSAAATSDSAQVVQSMTRDLAAMGQQIEQLKANIAELKAGQEQMAREMAKASQTKPAEAKIVDPRARLTALSPRPPAAAPRKPKPIHAPVSTPTTYAPAAITPPPPPSQAAALPPPPAPQQTADDDGPVVRPPMPLR